MKAAEQLSDRLRTLPASSATEIREGVVRALFETLEADFGLYFKCVERDDRWYYTAAVMLGDPELEAHFSPFVDEPVVESPWTRHHVDDGQIDRFIRTQSYFATNHLYSFPAQKVLMRPMDVTDNLRCVFHDGVEMHGWLGLLRRENDDEFTDREKRIANGAVDRLESALLSADEMECEAHGDRSHWLLARPDGRIEHASPAVRDWLTERRSESLGHLVRDYDRRADETPVRHLDGMTLHLTRLDGPSEVRYCVRLDRAKLARLDPLSRLTDRQTEIAEFAAAGATNREIAETLEISASTVKYHLRRTYRRLGIDGRVELGDLLGS